MRLFTSLLTIAVIALAAPGCGNKINERLLNGHLENISEMGSHQIQEYIKDFQDETKLESKADRWVSGLPENEINGEKKIYKSTVKEFVKQAQKRIQGLEAEEQRAFKLDPWFKVFVEQTVELDRMLMHEYPEAATSISIPKDASWYTYWSRTYNLRLAKQIKNYQDQLLGGKFTNETRDRARSELIADYGGLDKSGKSFMLLPFGSITPVLTSGAANLANVISQLQTDIDNLSGKKVKVGLNDYFEAHDREKFYHKTDYSGKRVYKDEELIAKLERTKECNKALLEQINGKLLPALTQRYE